MREDSRPGRIAYQFFRTLSGRRGGFEIKRETSKLAARRTSSVGRIDRLEESLYWLLSAATLLYLVLGIIAL